MEILVDTHCHTLASVHAYSTVQELAGAAKQRGIEMIAITDHGPDLGDAPMDWHFSAMKALPRMFDGVMLLRGAEVNITDYCGGLDLNNEVLKKLDWVIASMHTVVLAPGTAQQNTDAMIHAIENPLVDCVGHCGDSHYAMEYERLVKAVKQHGKIIEINNHSFTARQGSDVNCRTVAKLCKDYSVPIVVSSDAHFSTEVGVYPYAEKILASIEFPQELILNTTAEKLLSYLKEQKGLIFA